MSQKLLARGCLYVVDACSTDDIGQDITEAFNGKVEAGPTTLGSSVATSSFYFKGPLIVKNVFNNGNVTLSRVAEIFDNVTMSVTNYIRARGKDGFSTPDVGHVTMERPVFRSDGLG
jgi:hypothetical protein